MGSQRWHAEASPHVTPTGVAADTPGSYSQYLILGPTQHGKGDKFYFCKGDLGPRSHMGRWPEGTRLVFGARDLR